MSDAGSTLLRDLYILEDENNPMGSKADKVYPTTVLDQVYDDQDPDQKDLRTIIEELKHAIETGGDYVIHFPVESVNGKQGVVTITKSDLGLENVDNTRDLDKPLSEPQRQGVLNILSGYDFDGILDEVYDYINAHKLDHNNPHAVTFSQINSSGEITEAIEDLLHAHDSSLTAHQSILENISLLQDDINDLASDVDDRIAAAENAIVNHAEDTHAHEELFDLKQNATDKVAAVTPQNTTYDHYPSVRAMTEYVAAAIADYINTHDIGVGITDIHVVGRRNMLPAPGQALQKTAYFIIVGNHGTIELAICRKSGNTYVWEYSDLATYGQYDDRYFRHGDPAGLSLKAARISRDSLSDQTYLDELYYTIKDWPIGEGSMDEERVREIWIEEMHKREGGWIDPPKNASFYINDQGHLVMKYEDQYGDPTMDIDSNGQIYLEYDPDEATKLEKDLSGFYFTQINPDLWIDTEVSGSEDVFDFEINMESGDLSFDDTIAGVSGLFIEDGYLVLDDEGTAGDSILADYSFDIDPSGSLVLSTTSE